ncbi:MAG TPA: transposase family protein, partial [Legionellaceae bacterium]|nr:transposase family protein [Legionellaceae bacterium]
GDIYVGRFDNQLQRTFYQGWKSIHGLKYETLELANGITLFVSTPVSSRASDLDILAESDINNLFAQIQVGNRDQYTMFGDSIYPDDRSHIRTYNLVNNTYMKSIRIANEWHYGELVNLFPFMDYRCNMKMLADRKIKMYYYVCTILRNCHTCLYGNATSDYFRPVALPNLSAYISN